MTKHAPYRPPQGRQPLPRSFKDFTPAKHFNPRTFFREMVWKALLTRRTGQSQRPAFPKLTFGQVAITWIGHASFLVQFTDLNVLIDPNFANWLFLLKRIKRSGLRIEDLPPIDVVLLTHAHFDHFHKPTLRRLPHPKIGIMPWGVGDLAYNLGFGRVVELEWWESFCQRDWKVTLTPSKHWGARVLRDNQRGYGGFVLEHQGRRIYHAGDSAYFEGFKEIRKDLPAGDRPAADRRLPPGVVSPRAHGAGRGHQGLQGPACPMAGADALRHVPAFVRGPGRTAPLAAAARRARGADAQGAHARRRGAAGLLTPRS